MGAELSMHGCSSSFSVLRIVFSNPCSATSIRLCQKKKGGGGGGGPGKSHSRFVFHLC